MSKMMIVLLVGLGSSLFQPGVFAQDRSKERSVRSRLAAVERELEELVALAKKESSLDLESVTRLLRDTRELLNSMPRPSSQVELISVEMKFLEFAGKTADEFFFGRGPVPDSKSVPVTKTITSEELPALTARASTEIAAPLVLVMAGQETAVAIVNERDYAVLERDEDGRYSMHTVKAEEGIEVEVTASHLRSDQPAPPRARSMATNYGPGQPAPVHLRVTATIERVLGRSPCTENARQVGMPLVGKAAKELELVIVENQWVAARLPLPGSGQGTVILLLRAKTVK